MSANFICDCGKPYHNSASVLNCASNNHFEGPSKKAAPDRLATYEKWVVDAWDSGRGAVDLRGLFVMTTGASGELGEVQELLARELALIAQLSTCLGAELSDVTERVKKMIRNNRELTREEFTSECGDVLYYLVRLLAWRGISLAEAMDANRAKCDARIAAGKAPMPTPGASEEEDRVHLFRRGDTVTSGGHKGVVDSTYEDGIVLVRWRSGERSCIQPGLLRRRPVEDQDVMVGGQP